MKFEIAIELPDKLVKELFAAADREGIKREQVMRDLIIEHAKNGREITFTAPGRKGSTKNRRN